MKTPEERAADIVQQCGASFGFNSVAATQCERAIATAIREAVADAEATSLYSALRKVEQEYYSTMKVSTPEDLDKLALELEAQADAVGRTSAFGEHLFRSLAQFVRSDWTETVAKKTLSEPPQIT